MDVHSWLHNTIDRRSPDRSTSPEILDTCRQTLIRQPRQADNEALTDAQLGAHRAKLRHERVLIQSERSGSESELESPTPSSSAKYRRRSRHKTRADRYELKTSKRKVRREEATRTIRKTRRRDDTVALGIVRAFELNSRSRQKRLTLEPAYKGGLFEHGRSVCPVQEDGLPDLTFCRMDFLKRPVEPVNDAEVEYVAHKDASHQKRNQEVSNYFQTKTTDLDVTHHANTCSKHLSSSHDTAIDLLDITDTSQVKHAQGSSPPRNLSAAQLASSTSMMLPYRSDQTKSKFLEAGYQTPDLQQSKNGDRDQDSIDKIVSHPLYHEMDREPTSDKLDIYQMWQRPDLNKSFTSFRSTYTNKTHGGYGSQNQHEHGPDICMQDHDIRRSPDALRPESDLDEAVERSQLSKSLYRVSSQVRDLHSSLDTTRQTKSRRQLFSSSIPPKTRHSFCNMPVSKPSEQTWQHGRSVLSGRHAYARDNSLARVYNLEPQASASHVQLWRTKDHDVQENLTIQYHLHSTNIPTILDKTPTSVSIHSDHISTPKELSASVMETDLSQPSYALLEPVNTYVSSPSPRDRFWRPNLLY